MNNQSPEDGRFQEFMGCAAANVTAYGGTT
jgi:hypothetical protein